MAHVLFLSVIVIAIVGQCLCQDISWGWMSGSLTADSVRTDTNPGGRSGAAYWMQTDTQAVWMFGGETHDDTGLQNDLWKLDLTSLTWSMIHNGSAPSPDEVPAMRQLAAACGIQDSYFVLFGGLGLQEESLGDTWFFYIPESKWYTLEDFRIKLGASNLTSSTSPSARGDAAVWCYNTKDLVIFGGVNSEVDLEHDLWVFNLEQLAWSQSKMSSKLPADSDFVQHLQVPAGRSGATTWISKGKLYMFGGNIHKNNPRSRHLNIGNSNDMWMYNIGEDEWSFVTGSKQACQKGGQYGDLGVASVNNQPGCRRKAASWVDHHQNLWMYGGDGVDSQTGSLSVFSHSQLLSDIWYFDTQTHEWTWKGGSYLGDQKGKHGNLGQIDESYLPGSRCEMVVWGTWDLFYLYGGVGHDGNGRDGYLSDVWQLDVHVDSAVKRNSPRRGTVAALILLGMGLAIFIVVIYIFSRGQWFTEKKGLDYAPIPRDNNDNL